MDRPVSRRRFLGGGCTGAAALGGPGWPREAWAAGAVNPLAVKAAAFPGRRRSGSSSCSCTAAVAGGHVRPQAAAGTRPRQAPALRPSARVVVVPNRTGNLLGSPFEFRQHGESGICGQRALPAPRDRGVDDLCVINSMHGSNSRHGGAVLELHTGSDTFVRPSMGSWVTYGLGTREPGPARLHHDLPDLTHGGANNWSSGFLPAAYQGTPIGHAGSSRTRSEDPVHRRRARRRRDLQRLELDLIARDRIATHLRTTGPTASSTAGSPRSSWPSGCRPRRPELQDISTNRRRRAALRARRPGDRRLRPPVPAGPPVRRSGASGSSRSATLGELGPAQRPQGATTAELRPRDRQADRRPADRPQGARAARRHAGHLGRRVRPHADLRGDRRPRPQPARLHHVAGRRRRQGRASPTARPTTTATTPSRTRSTSTTCTPRSSTCSASTTSG